MSTEHPEELWSEGREAEQSVCNKSNEAPASPKLGGFAKVTSLT